MVRNFLCCFEPNELLHDERGCSWLAGDLWLSLFDLDVDTQHYSLLQGTNQSSSLSQGGLDPSCNSFRPARSLQRSSRTSTLAFSLPRMKRGRSGALQQDKRFPILFRCAHFGRVGRAREAP